MPRVQRCPKHTRRKPRKTGKCIPYEPPYKTKYIRCPNGERKNKQRECEKYIPTEPKYRRCNKGFRKDANGDCKPFKKDLSKSNSTTVSDSKHSKSLKEKLKKQLQEKKVTAENELLLELKQFLKEKNKV